ncbi:hypothetical protein C3B59_05575 [Cryobacterium zongtaii]|uniref:Bifunctional diguanylate cyclase/phosphodiesterase n=1 Tax=Cryobacterium zongtaii TaxID=1259217 RepID=A0A2S3ZLN9_9MICO|nr:bifunctional diguanylate cyclase/phosphodiesterase [Cryobacterium zongtaii]POH69458.1 hypothetical protein C3B59_05575 [Cryobacterium zongtaii]
MGNDAARHGANASAFLVNDSVTGLLNSSQFMKRAEELFYRQENGHESALLLVDLDRFSVVNNSLGHDVGDEVLRYAAQQITAALQPEDTVARVGSDEFLILCMDANDAQSAIAIGDRIVQSFDRPAVLNGVELQLSVSVGITSVTRRQNSIDIMHEVDSAMQRAKSQGGNQASLFEQGYSSRALYFLELEQALRKALDREEFILNFQPIYNAFDGALHGFEALVRWNRPGRGMVPPDEFIPAAESTGLILRIGDWVIDEALRQLSEWRQSNRFPAKLTVSVNVSPFQLANPNLVSLVRQLLTKHHLAPSDLLIEMTETAFVADESRMQATVRELAAAGVGLSIDDFGTGYSSLAYLRYLPAKELKIDRSFVAGLTTNARDEVLVSAVIALAHALDMTCVAEGVETAEQLEHLRRLGCDQVQGYFLGRPVPASALAETWQE